jgi:outer membrane usher protein FimD/PapC
MFFFVTMLMLGAPFTAVSDSRAEATTSSGTIQLAPDSRQFAAAYALPDPPANVPRLSRPTTPLVVVISVNKETKGDFFVERDDAGELFVKVGDLLSLKLKFTQDRILLIGDEKFVSLNAVRDITSTFDEKNLTVAVMGKTTEAKKTSIELYSLDSRPRNVYYPGETSAFFNYGLAYSYSDPLGFQAFTASNKLGVRSKDLFFISDSLYRKTETSGEFVRLSSNVTYERRDRLQWLVFGDQFASSGHLGSSVNMGGIGFSKLYRLDPYFITQPLFTISGIAQFPTEADVYMDGVLVGRHAVAPGSFDLRNIYSYTGSHVVDVVLRDPFGNEQRISHPLYFSAQLLRQGLHEYSYNAGFVREQYGMESSEYGKSVFSGFHRYGVTSSFNAGGRAEGSDGIYNGGLFTSFSLPRFGAFTVSAACSTNRGEKGSASSFQHAYQYGSFSFNLMLSGFSREYATVGTARTSDMIRYAKSLGTGFLIRPLGSFSLAYSSDETYAGVNTRVVSASYSRALTRTISVFATASSTRRDDDTNSFYVGISFNPDRNIHGTLQASSTGKANMQALQMQKDMPVGEGVGYRASLNRSDNGASTEYSFNPAVQYNARYGVYGLDAAILNSQGGTRETYTFSAAGSFLYAGGFFGISRPVSDSFTIVMVDRLPDAGVLNNGQEIGKTDSSGMMVVPTLSSYNYNQISLDLKNLPEDYSFSGVNARLSPSQWSGSCVSFDTLKVRAVTGTLSLKKGDRKIPLEYRDMMMTVRGRALTFPTGKGGEFYLENGLPEDPQSRAGDRQSCRAIAERRKSGGNVIVPGTYPAKINYEGGTCLFSIAFPDTDEVITDIGEVECVPEKP